MEKGGALMARDSKGALLRAEKARQLELRSRPPLIGLDRTAVVFVVVGLFVLAVAILATRQERQPVAAKVTAPVERTWTIWEIVPLAVCRPDPKDDSI